MTLLEQLDHYFDRVDEAESTPMVVAFSGGVDSSVVASAAYRYARLRNKRAIAVTAVSPSVPDWQREMAQRVAGEIGIEHRTVQTDELENDQYRRNDHQRCYHCKQTLYATLNRISESHQSPVFSGTNADDLSDHRPGLVAGRQANVRTPLADLHIGKPGVRQLARQMGLSNAELPASPCLASRIAYGVEVTPARLRMIEQAEDYLRAEGFPILRVRFHEQARASIEVPRDRLPDLIETDRRRDLSEVLSAFGFKSVVVDLAGFRSGSLNEDVPALTLVRLGESGT